MTDIDRLKDVDSITTTPCGTQSMAALCLYAQEIDMEKLTSLIGCEPTAHHNKGEIKKSKTGRPNPPYPTGLWELEAPAELPFREQIEYLIQATTPDHEIWKGLADSHTIALRCAMFLHSWTDGFGLPVGLLQELGARYWPFWFSAYSAEGDEIVAAFLKPSAKKECTD